MAVNNDRRRFTMRSFIARAIVGGYCEKISDTAKERCNIEFDDRLYQAFWVRVKRTGEIFPVLEMEEPLGKTKLGWLCETWNIPEDEFDYIMKHLIEPPADN